MSEFRGLHNPERHKGNQPDTRCVRCHGGYEVCAPDAACYCCLQAEVEALRAQVQAVRRLTFEWAQNSTCPPWRRINAIRNILDGER